MNSRTMPARRECRAIIDSASRLFDECSNLPTDCIDELSAMKSAKRKALSGLFYLLRFIETSKDAPIGEHPIRAAALARRMLVMSSELSGIAAESPSGRSQQGLDQ
jgi:hypothetical protein